MGTIDTTSTITFHSAAELIRRLEELAVQQDHLARALENPGIMRELAEVLRQLPPRLPKELDAQACVALVANLYPARIDENGKTRCKVTSSPIYGDERVHLSKPETVAKLLSELTPMQLRVVLMRSRLDGREELSAEHVAAELGLSSANKVNTIRREARKVMIGKVDEMLRRWRRTYIFD